MGFSDWATKAANAVSLAVLHWALGAFTGGRVGLREPAQHIIVLHTPAALFLWTLLLRGEVGLGEMYTRGQWSADVAPLSAEHKPTHSDALFRLLRALAPVAEKQWLLEIVRWLSPFWWLEQLRFRTRFGALDKASSAASIAEHYDDGNRMFRAMLGQGMVYTAASFEGRADGDLESAQRVKVGRLLDLAGVVRGKKMLDIGSGWGFLVNQARERGAAASGLCNCKSMVDGAATTYGPHFRMLDYRDLPPTHDHDAITSVEMIEAVPAKDYPTFVAACDNALKPGGKVAMQIIHAFAYNNPVARRRNPKPMGTFVTTYIFPGQQVPVLERLYDAFAASGKFRLVSTETCGHDYTRTLQAWRHNLDAAAKEFPADTVRKYRYYLAWCQAAFDAEMLHVSRVAWQKKE